MRLCALLRCIHLNGLLALSPIPRSLLWIVDLESRISMAPHECIPPFWRRNDLNARMCRYPSCRGGLFRPFPPIPNLDPSVCQYCDSSREITFLDQPKCPAIEFWDCPASNMPTACHFSYSVIYTSGGILLLCSSQINISVVLSIGNCAKLQFVTLNGKDMHRKCMNDYFITRVRYQRPVSRQ